MALNNQTGGFLAGGRLRALALLLALVVGAAPASAQMLASGTWTGALTMGSTEHPATASIKRCATGFDVSLTVAGRTTQTETAQYSRGRLAADFPRIRLPGTIIPRALSCRLAMRADGSFGGTCTSGGTEHRLSLRPPADGSVACD